MIRKINAVLFVFVLLLCVTNNYECQVLWMRGVAQAESSTVTATGEVNIRSGPGLDYEMIESVSAGTQLEYAGETSADSRGVSWYKVILSGSSTGWMSSKYARLHEMQSISTEEPISVNASVEQPMSGEVLSREDIVRRYGVFNFNELINTTDVQVDQTGDVQMFTVYFEDDVYWGGSDGYGADWMATNGIAAELLCDLDGDGVDEYTIFYVSSHVIDEYDYSYIENQWTAAIFEPVSGGYVFADSFEFNFEWTSDGGESAILLLNSEKGMRIVYGSVGYWDGGNGGISGTFYGYDGSSVYVDLAFDTETASSAYILAGRIDEDRLEQAIALCGEYRYSDEVPDEDIIGNARLFFPNRTSEGFGSLYDYKSDPPRMQMEYMNCIEMAADMAAEYGCTMGYTIEGNSYELYFNGGQQLLWRCEDYRNNQDCIDLKFHSPLDHFSQTGNVDDAMTADDAAELYRVENPLSSGMIDIADGEVVNAQQDIRVNLNMRDDSGIYYINFYRINGTVEEWFYGDEISKYGGHSYFVIPANLFIGDSYRIDVDAWIGSGGHNDEKNACESVYFYAMN